MPAPDPYGFSGAPDGPYIDAFVVALSDSVDMAKLSSALRFPVAKANCTVVMQSGAAVDIGPVAAGEIIRIRVKRINATGTTAGDTIIALI